MIFPRPPQSTPPGRPARGARIWPFVQAPRKRFRFWPRPADRKLGPRGPAPRPDETDSHSIPRPRAPFRTLRVWLSAVALLGVCGALAPTAGAASTTSTASVTDATTGLPDASSVVPLDACGSPTALRAACLAKVLGVRGTALVRAPAAAPSGLSLPARRPDDGRTCRRPPPPRTVAAVTAPQPGTPAYLQQAYDLAYLSQTAGAGATIAIVDAFDDPNAEADLAAYRAEFSLPACTTANGCFSKVDQTGGTDYPSTVNSGLGARDLARSRRRVRPVPELPHRARRGEQRQHLGPRRGAGEAARRVPAPSPTAGP